VLGASRTAVFPPLSLVVDLAQYPSHQSGTYWAAREGRSVPDWMDAVFTNLVVRPLPGALWWAAWCIENRVLIHTRIGVLDPSISWDSLLLGYSLAYLALLADRNIPFHQELVPVAEPGGDAGPEPADKPEFSHSSWPGRVTRLAVTALAWLASLNVWRGVWSWLDQAFLPLLPPTYNHVASLVIGTSTLTLLQCASTLGADWCPPDPAQGRVLEIRYWGLLGEEVTEEGRPLCKSMVPSCEKLSEATTTNQ